MAATYPSGESASSRDEQQGQARLNPIMAAALVGGTVAAAAGAYFGTRALARRNHEKDGRPLNSVMATAITACDLAHSKNVEPATATEPCIPSEPPV
jgi:hypothetical protein